MYFIYFLNFILFTFAGAETTNNIPSVNKKPLVLQWTVSHYRNTDQISLIFRQQAVELVTNTSSYQTAGGTQLGHFKSAMSPELKILKQQIERYYIRLKKTVPISSLIKDPRFQSAPDPHAHAPVLRINEETVHDEHIDFKPLAKIIREAWKREWVCIKCAAYKLAVTKPQTKNKDKIARPKAENTKIIREVKTMQKERKNKSPAKTSPVQQKVKTQIDTFSKKQLNCITNGNNKIECVDPQFGIFEL